METSIDKCLAFCQSLAMSGQKFSCTLSIGKDNFSFNNKELGSSSCTRKKKSPSQIRREQRRKIERSLKKAAEPTEKVAEASESEESGSIINAVLFQCSQCDFNFKAEEDLNAHIDDMHTSPILPTPEKERAPDQIADLLMTPIHGQRKEEDTIPSLPSFSVVCDMPRTFFQLGRKPMCGKTFTLDFRCHIIWNIRAAYRGIQHPVHGLLVNL